MVLAIPLNRNGGTRPAPPQPASNLTKPLLLNHLSRARCPKVKVIAQYKQPRKGLDQGQSLQCIDAPCCEQHGENASMAWTSDIPCPCGLPQPYAQCCGRWHAGPLHLQAPDAQ
jgi:hypothetical protein